MKKKDKTIYFQALKDLPREYGLVFVMKYADKLTSAEIAQVLRMSPERIERFERELDRIVERIKTGTWRGAAFETLTALA